MAETGHAINVANLHKAVQIATGWGAKYQPSNPLISIVNMTAAATAADNSLDDVQTKITPYRNATAAADDAFDPLSKLTTRVVKAMKAQGIAASAVEDANTYARKIKGKRATPKKKDDPSTPNVDESKSSVSASQMSRTQRIEHFDSLNSMLASQSLYKPNEVDLKLATLTAYSNDLKAKTEAVTTTFVPFSNSLADRDQVLYINDDSIVNTGKLFRTYVESAFGRTSNEWNQVKGLVFKDLSRT